MQKKLNSFIKKEIDKFEHAKFIEGLAFKQLKRVSIGKKLLFKLKRVVIK